MAQTHVMVKERNKEQGKTPKATKSRTSGIKRDKRKQDKKDTGR